MEFLSNPAILIPLITAVLGALAAGYFWLKNGKLKGLLDKTQLDELLEIAVYRTKVEFVDQLKAKSTDGKLTLDDAKAAANYAFNVFKEEAAKAKQPALSELNELVIRKGIEFALSRMKNGN
jgi:hypothetical protein